MNPLINDDIARDIPDNTPPFDADVVVFFGADIYGDTYVRGAEGALVTFVGAGAGAEGADTNVVVLPVNPFGAGAVFLPAVCFVNDGEDTFTLGILPVVLIVLISGVSLIMLFLSGAGVGSGVYGFGITMGGNFTSGNVTSSFGKLITTGSLSAVVTFLDGANPNDTG